MSMFEKGENLLAAAFAYAAVKIDYFKSGEIAATQIPAKLGKTLFRAEDSFGVTIRTEQRDFIVRSEDLDVTPEVGDEIHYDGKIYLVTAPNGENCWIWHTRQSHTQKRIHTKYNGELQN